MSIRRIKEVFGQAEAMAPAERAAFLDDELAGDPAARAEVEALLAAIDELPDAAFGPLVASNESFASVLDAPERIGPYRIVSLLGRGGMAYVYRAVQDHPIRREVALKVVRPGFDAQGILARFDSERQALARLEHRNVATVLDAGADPYGPSWFSMSVIDGPPITDHCEAQGLCFRERLQLFVQVCRGVQHAHVRGILHRDLKPSNILVSLEDGEAIPTIIDFGVAKALGADVSLGDVKQTLDTQLVGTLEYMSPEQARLGNPDVDARSDVYALGVVLYELLTGRVPIGGDAFRGRSLDRIQALIESKPVERASLRSHVGAPADFDCVVAKALEKQPDDRYETPRDLADDVERYLDGRPLAVRPPTRLYLFTRFAKRNRPLVGAVSGGLLLLLIGLVGTSIGLYREHRVTLELADANASLRSNADALRIALDDAEELSERTRKIFFGIQPERDGRDVTLREAIVGAARGQLEASPEPRYAPAALAQSLMDPLWTLGEYELSAAMASQVIAWAGTDVDGRDPIMAMRALWRRGHARSRLGEGEGAYEDFARSMEIADRSGADGAAYRYRARFSLGEWYDARARFDRGLASKLEALAILETEAPDATADRAVVLGQIGRTYSQLGDAAQALEYAERGLRLRQSIATPNDLQVLMLQRTVALVAMEADDYAKASALLEPHVPALVEALGPESTEVLYSGTLLAVCRAKEQVHPAADVLAELRSYVAVAERVAPPRLSLFLRAYEANAFLAYGRLDDALARGADVLRDGVASFGDGDDRQMQLRLMLATELVAYGHHELAAQRLESLLEDLRTTRPLEDPLVQAVQAALDACHG